MRDELGVHLGTGVSVMTKVPGRRMEVGGLTISDPPTQAAVQGLRDKCAELVDDAQALSMLVHALRTALVNAGLIKGAA